MVLGVMIDEQDRLISSERPREHAHFDHSALHRQRPYLSVYRGASVLARRQPHAAPIVSPDHRTSWQFDRRAQRFPHLERNLFSGRTLTGH